MSFFAYLATPASKEANQIKIILQQAGLLYKESALSAAHGARQLYGIGGPLLEWELLDGEAQDLELQLLDLADPDARIQHYCRIAKKMGSSATAFHDDSEVDQVYLRSPLPLPIFRLLQQLEALKIPVVLNLDVDFKIRLGEGRVLAGEAVQMGIWEAVAFGDLQQPLQLQIGPRS